MLPRKVFTRSDDEYDGKSTDCKIYGVQLSLYHYFAVNFVEVFDPGGRKKRRRLTTGAVASTEKHNFSDTAVDKTGMTLFA